MNDCPRCGLEGGGQVSHVCMFSSREVITLRTKLSECEREKDAYKKAKAENDERFQLEIGTLKAHVQELEAEVARLKGERL